VPSSVTAGARVALEFSPDAAMLERAIAALDESDEQGGAVAPDARRAALERYAGLPAPGARPGKSWRYDYASLDFAGLTWSSARQPIAALQGLAQAQRPGLAQAQRPGLTQAQRPGLSQAQRVDDDASADNLWTANAGGLIHIGATVLEPRETPQLDPRVTVLPLADALRTHADVIAGILHATVGFQSDRYAALTTAFQNCGAFVFVPSGVQLDEPIVLVFASAPDPTAVFPQVVVVLGEGARATVLERHIGEAESFVCATVEAHVGARAQLDYVVVQQAPESSRVIATRVARCDPQATMRWHLAELGAGLARTSLETRLEGEGSDARIDALFFNTGMQHVDLSTAVRHETGHTTSGTIVRSAANDRGQGRYLGNIIILPHAHGSDASLRDDALLLSKRAHIDSIPALEIAANDVKAFHGATVGSIDDEQLFYAQSRGIGRGEAERMIALGFFEPAITHFPSEALRNEVRSALDAKLDDATERHA